MTGMPNTRLHRKDFFHLEDKISNTDGHIRTEIRLDLRWTKPKVRLTPDTIVNLKDQT